MIEILTSAQLSKARATGALVAHILQTLKSRSIVGTNLLEIDQWAKAMIMDAGADSCYVDYAPSFGRGPFGHYICTSVNDGVLHGLPHDYVLADGDLLSLDLAVLLDGIAADSAISFIVGPTRPTTSVALIDATQRALQAHGLATFRTQLAQSSPTPATRSTLTLAGMASVLRCTRIHTSPITDVLVADISFGPDCCLRSSLGSWSTLLNSLRMLTDGRCVAQRVA